MSQRAGGQAERELQVRIEDPAALWRAWRARQDAKFDRLFGSEIPLDRGLGRARGEG